MGDPLMPRRGLVERVARASFPRLAAGILTCAGLVAAAAVPFLPGPSRDRPPAPPSTPVTAGSDPRPAPVAAPGDGTGPASATGLDAAPARPVPAAVAPRLDQAEIPATPKPLAPATDAPEPARTAGPTVATAPAPSTSQPQAQAAERVPPAPADAPPVDPGTWTSTPQPELRDKAEFLLAKGDVASARLWLDMAAGRGDAEAMFRLAESYDPAMLAEWRVVGLSSDAGRARGLYAKALSGGVEAARARLERLSPDVPATGAAPAPASPGRP